MQATEKMGGLGILLNTFLFIIKIVAGIMSGSLALMSDAFNSLTDILASTAIFLAVKISNQKADADHPFGHRRAEPIAGFFVAILAGVLGVEIVREAIKGIIENGSHEIGTVAIVALLITIAVKTFMSIYFSAMGKKYDRPALRATGVDSRNDIYVSSIALLGVIGSRFGYYILDDIAALIIAMFLFYSQVYKLGMENLDYLMGKCPPQDMIESIKRTALGIKGVKGINDVRAHYVGNYIHIEIHIEVDKKMTTMVSHDIGKEVQRAVERHKHVDKAFIHVDPV